MNRCFSRAFTLVALLPFALVSRAQAQVTPVVSPFAGTHSESFESFANYRDTSGFFLTAPVSVFGGNATLSGSANMLIYQPGTTARFQLADSGFAQIADGSKGLALSSDTETLTFTFSSPITDFGGYFGATTGQGYPDPATILVNFFDAASAPVGAAQSFNYSRSGNNADGQLLWQGWSFSAPVTSVTLSAPFLVGDSFQANVAAVPEPSEWATMGFGALGLAGLFLRARRKKTFAA